MFRDTEAIKKPLQDDSDRRHVTNTSKGVSYQTFPVAAFTAHLSPLFLKRAFSGKGSLT